MKVFRLFFRKILLSIPVFNRRPVCYKLLGINYIMGGGRISPHTLVGDYKNLYLHPNSEINKGCFLLAKDRIEIGENSTLA